MTLTFYKQEATPNRVDKSNYLQSQGDLSDVVIKDNTNLMTPTFILKTNPLVYNSNYVYCSYTSRYYYIESIDALKGGRIAIHCKIDVLYTYKDEILNSSGWVVRSDSTSDTTGNYNMMHNDYPFRADYDIIGFDFTAGGDAGMFNKSWPAGDYKNIILIMK